MAIRYPALFIGGPPNSGKSWLTYHLSRALKRRQVTHYVLRAHPDGEGHWRYEAPLAIVNELRRQAKQGWTAAFATRISRDITGRHLPLLVNSGGKVSDETRLILAHCTGAILIATDPARLDPWRALVDDQALPLLADLRSDLDGPQALDDQGVTLRGAIGGLGSERSPAGDCFDALVERLDRLCRFDPALLFRTHAALLDGDPLDVEAPINNLPAHSMPDTPWRPQELPQLLEDLDSRMPLAVYGASPPWVYAALASATDPAPIQIFNVALGWVAPPPLAPGMAMDVARLRWELADHAPAYRRMRFTIPSAYLDYDDAVAAPLPVPAPTPGCGVVLDGRLPNWLYAALARAYAPAAWVGIYEPRSRPAHAVIVRSRLSSVPLGSVYPIALDTAPADDKMTR